jgi:hypothetical protein
MRNWTMPAIALLATSCLGTAALAAPDRAPNLRIGPAMMLRDVITPVEWSGIWEFDQNVYDCDTNDLLTSEAYTDTICAGSSIDYEYPGFQLTCTGSANANTVSVTCTGSFDIFEACVMNFSSVFNATRNGDTFQSVQTVTTTYVGAGCLFLPNDCTRTETTATRIAPQPEPCGLTPVESVDWGTVKSLYR